MAYALHLPATVRDYVQIARPDHWIKNIFMLPGLVFAIIMTGGSMDGHYLHLLWATLSVCLVASANYVINEYLDAEFDRYHPRKKSRPSVSGRIRPQWVVVEYLALGICGVLFARLVSVPFYNMALLLLFMGVVYNVKPFRSKDRIYLDVLSESVNNPIRFLMGWFIITSVYLPPASLVLSYWFGGAFLMGVKRFSEYRFINDPGVAGLYRRSFRFYTEESLLISTFLYALMSIFFLGTFLIKYKIEYLLIIPFIAGLFAWYLRIGMKPNSAAQHPERLYKERRLMAYMVFLMGLFIGLLFVEIPQLQYLLRKELLSMVP